MVEPESIAERLRETLDEIHARGLMGELAKAAGIARSTIYRARAAPRTSEVGTADDLLRFANLLMGKGHD